jgi:hypothetical protein
MTSKEQTLERLVEKGMVAPGLGDAIKAELAFGDPALKKDIGKDPWHLAPWDALRCVVLVLAFGAQKYAPRGWEVGMAWSRLFAATQRHLTAWWHKEGTDPDTGYSHLWHAGCCVMFLIAYELRGKGEDDRP